VKLLVSAQGPDLTAPVDPRFGRAPSFVLVDTESGDWSAYVNPGAGMGQGAGIEAARLAVELGADVVVTGPLGPHALQTLAAAKVPVCLIEGGCVADVVEQWRAGLLRSSSQAVRVSHTGAVGGGGQGMGRGAGAVPGTHGSSA